MPILEERLKAIESLPLKSGLHVDPGKFSLTEIKPDAVQMCVMEAVAFVAGEPWSDHPECACPIISSFLRSWNDCLRTDADRDRLLKPLIRKLVGTRNKALEERRGPMAADWLIRVNTPAWLRLAGLTVHADSLANLPEITAFAQIPPIRGPIEAARKNASAVRDAAGAAARDAVWAAARDAVWAAARDAARDAVRDAAGAAARDAVWAAARDAARDAALDAVRATALDAVRAAAWAAALDAVWAAAGAAARDPALDAARAAAGAAARDAVWAAARDAARDAVWAAVRAAARDPALAAARDAALDAVRAAALDAAGAKLKPTMDELQASAVQLIERMIALTEAK